MEVSSIPSKGGEPVFVDVIDPFAWNVMMTPQSVDEPTTGQKPDGAACAPGAAANAKPATIVPANRYFA